MKRFLAVLAVVCLAAFLLAPVASADFGFEDVDLTFTGPDGSTTMQAGSHPFAATFKLDLNTAEDPESGEEVPEGAVKDLTIELPPGFIGSIDSVPYCSSADFLEVVAASLPACPNSSVVGTSTAHVEIETPPPGNLNSPVYALAPPPGVAAKFGFIAFSVPVTIEATINPNPPYNIISKVSNIAQVALFYGSKTTLWGVPADPAHDPIRGSCLAEESGEEIGSNGNCPVNIPEKPFLTLPRSCSGPLTTIFEALAWNTGEEAIGFAETHDGSEPPNPLGMSGCSKLGFAPQLGAQPTTDQAESPTGLNVNVDVNDEGLINPSGIAQSDIEKAVVTLPEGVTINPSQAEGLATCSEEELQGETVNSEPGEGCPQASKVGTVEAETPLAPGELLKGSVFVATPYENPFDSLIAIYITVKDPKLGVVVRLAGEVEPDPETGQLITTVDEIPQVPVSHFRFHFREGGRSPLVTPPSCGTYTTTAEFTPSANPAKVFTTTSSFQITRGVGGGSCPPAGAPPFVPGFEAGTINNNAGSYSPFYMRLTRRDGDQDLTKFSATLPPGMVAKLAGVSQCPGAAIANARAKTGKQELASPSCPASSQIGRVLGGAGVGSQLTYVPGKLYLSGPLNGAPLSVVAIVPAVAGPFDVGNVVTQVALQVDPRSAEVRVDGSRSDPLPHILAGIPLKVRDIRVYADRPSFTLNPTNCDPFKVGAEIWGGGSDVFSAADDSPVNRFEPFQAANCASLGFKPALSFGLKGGTKRGGHPKLKIVLAPRPGDANLSGLVFRLPHSAFLDQAHIRTICTRVQFAAKSCPAGSVYGHVRAFTPLLDQPLEGPVYLRSSNHNLPDAVAALHGLVDFEAVGRIDSLHGGIRVNVEGIPDAPISKVVVDMQGGKKGLIINSRDLCARSSKADVQMSAQNAKRHNAKPPVKAGCGASGKAPRHQRG